MNELSGADYKSIVEGAPSLLLVLTPDLTIVTASNAYLRATMCELDQIVGRRLFDVFPDNPEDPEATGVRNLTASIQTVLSTRQPHTMAIQRYDIRKPESEGGGFEERFWSPVNWPALGPDDEVRFIVHRVEDVTQLVRLTRLEQAQREREADHVRELAALNQELEAFSYSVSHDLRAPLRHVAGFAAMLGKRLHPEPDGDIARYLAVIVDATNRMGRLIDDLLAFSRLGRKPVVKQRVALAALIAEAQRELAPEMKDREVEWIVSNLPDIDGDPALLRPVFVNLLSNALKYSRERAPARIEVGARPGETPDEVVVFVRDNGVGFDMRYADKLFGVFQRLHAEHEFEGTGIGLANVQRIVHRHGGRVWAEGAVGRGATISIALPRASG